MKIFLLNIGKPHEPYISAGVDDFTKRIEKYFPVQWLIIPPVKNASSLPESELKKQEANTILSKISGDDFLILLDEKGKQMSSEELAAFIETKANMNTKNLVFLIGGAFGVDEKIKQRANYIWSFSKLVFPHMLMRLMLAEQVYRACTILRNEKYHHK